MTRSGDMRILWDEPIVMDDGIVLRADVYLPVGDGTFPAVASMGPYGPMSSMDGRPVCGEEEFTDEQLAAHRENLPADLLEHRFDDGSLPWPPHHPHQEEEPLVPGQVYPLDIEIWPVCIVIPSGYRLGLSILGRDPDRGVGPFRHNDPTRRPAEIYGGDVTVYAGGDRASYLLLPVIPRPVRKNQDLSA
jgi:predicted acyl esterase